MSAAEATDKLASLVDAPAVGTPLPFDDVSLPESVEADPSPSHLDAAETGVTAGITAIADYGSVVLAERGGLVEAVSLYADLHIVVVAASDVMASMGEAIQTVGDEVRDGLTSAIVATGPSATADMGELVTGAHGPITVHVVLLTDR